MARPTWVNIADADIAQDALVKTGTVVQALRDNARAARVATFGVDIAADSTTSATAVTVTGSTFALTIDSVTDYTGIQRQVLLDIEAWVSSGTGQVRLVDVTNTTNGAWIDVTATAAGYGHGSIAVDAVAGVADYRVEFRHPTGATVNARALNHYTGRVEY